MKLSALIKKEFYRFFHDPRLIVGVILPGVLIFLLYTLLGSIIQSTEAETYNFRVYRAGDSAAVAVIEAAAIESGNTVEWLELTDLDAAEAEIREEKATAIVRFSNGFDEAGGEADVYYNSESTESYTFGSMASAILQEYGMRFSLNVHDLVTEHEFQTRLLSGIMPMLIVCFAFTASMGLTIESVAGEKERGTLSTLLVTSVKRSHVALGKIISLACISLLGAVSGFLGVALSMPRMMGMTSFIFDFGVLNYVLLFLLIVSIVPFIVASIALISTYSKTVKEASAYTSIIMIFFIVISMVTAFVSSIGDWVVAVPVLNAVALMQRLMTGALPVWQTFAAIGCNIVYTAAIVFAMAKMFSSEKIMFGR